MTLDFGNSPFTGGSPLWLSIDVRTRMQIGGSKAPKAAQSHPNATSRPVDSQLIATPRPPQCANKATLILMRVQSETNNPGPCTDAPHTVSVCSQPRQAHFQGSHHPGHV